MAIRIRKNGDIVCAAMTKSEEGDTYIDDGIHYTLSVLCGAIVPSKNHEKDALWFWNIRPDMVQHAEEIGDKNFKVQNVTVNSNHLLDRHKDD